MQRVSKLVHITFTLKSPIVHWSATFSKSNLRIFPHDALKHAEGQIERPPYAFDLHLVCRR